jgi:hypothetical protein
LKRRYFKEAEEEPLYHDCWEIEAADGTKISYSRGRSHDTIVDKFPKESREYHILCHWKNVAPEARQDNIPEYIRSKR